MRRTTACSGRRFAPPLMLGVSRIIAMVTVREAISRADATLPGHAAKNGDIDPRWQAVIAVAEFIESDSESVWLFAHRWGCSSDEDLRAAIATCILEHLLEYDFDTFISRVEEAASADRHFAQTVSICRKLGQTKEPARAARFDKLLASIRTQAG